MCPVCSFSLRLLVSLCTRSCFVATFSKTFDRNGRFDIGRKFLSISGMRSAFFNKGVTAASLNDLGTCPFENDWLMIQVIRGERMSRHSLTILVGTGSKLHDFGAAALMILITSSSVTSPKSEKQGPSKRGSGSKGNVGFWISANPSWMVRILFSDGDV